MTERKKKKNRFAEILRLQRLPLRMTELERKEIASRRSFASLRMIQKSDARDPARDPEPSPPTAVAVGRRVPVAPPVK